MGFREKLKEIVVGVVISFVTVANLEAKVSLKYATFFFPNEQAGILAKKYIEFAEKAAKGQLEIKAFFSGTLGAPPEYLRLIETGTIDLTTVLPPFVQKDLPLYLMVPYALPGGEEKSLIVYRRIVLEDPTSSAIIEAEAMERNLRFLTFVSMGPNAIISRIPIASLNDLRGKKMGGAEDEWNDFAVTGVSLTPQEGYEALSRGLVDMFSMGFTPSIDLKYYEVAKYYVMDNLYGVGLPIAINAKRWASLPGEIKDALLRAGKELSDFSIKLAQENTKKGMELLKAKGVTVTYLSSKDTEVLFKVIELKNRRAKVMRRAIEKGKAHEASTIMNITNKIIHEAYGIIVE